MLVDYEIDQKGQLFLRFFNIEDYSKVPRNSIV